MVVRPSSMVLTMTRIALRPGGALLTEGIDPLTERLISPCKTKLRLISDQAGLLGDVCGGFSGHRRWIGLRNHEVRSISDSSGDALSLISTPRLLMESYRFGLLSYRVVAVVQVSSHDQEGILASWRRMAAEFRRVLEDRMRGLAGRGSLLSQYFSEVYPFYELSMSLPEITRRWSSELEPSLIPSPEELRFFLSPLKLSSPPPDPELLFLPNPVYLSRDGVFVFSHYDPMEGGKRRNIHLTRRKRRRLLRLAIDLALGLKVFLDNEDLWLMGTETMWGALTGMIHLNPRVVSSLMRGQGRRFLDFYGSLLRSMNLLERFESYEKLFVFFFPTEKHMQAFLHTVRLLGGSAPDGRIQLPLSDLQLALLKILTIKEGLDVIVEEWEEGPLECLSKFLCEYARLLGGGTPSDSEGRGLSLVEMALRNARPGELKGCAKELFDHIRSRRGRRTGLTSRELSIILGEARSLAPRTAHLISTNLEELEREGVLTVVEGRRGRVRRSGDRTRRGLPVRVFHLNHANPVVSHLERIMEDVIRRILEAMVENRCFQGRG